MSAPTTLLLDMDGVLAEVSQSYRSCILLTCQYFLGSAVVTNEIVSARKTSGGCNNDWILSLELITAHLPPNSPPPTLESVTSKFEELYQGTPTTPGLSSLETLIPARGVLVELRRRLPNRMGIVTGRPRKDCETFLRLHDVSTAQELTAVDHTPVNHTPVDHTPVNHTPVDHTPVNHTPVNHTPVNHTPVNHTPVDHTPVNHTPVNHTPTYPSHPPVQLTDLFDCCVCMEDGPAKPDKFPFLKACELLSVSPATAVIVGDTPDDIRSGVAAGGAGIAVALPDDDARCTLAKVGLESVGIVKAMVECGAERVIRPGLAELLDLFGGVM